MQPFDSPMVRFSKLRSIGTKRMASAKKNSSSKGRSRADKQVRPVSHRATRDDIPIEPHSTSDSRFAICVRNDEYEASLELRKLYPVLEDRFANQHGMIRIVDESGEDYLFPAEYFVRVSLPQAVEKKLVKIA